MDEILEIRSMKIYAAPDDGTVWLTMPITWDVTEERAAGRWHFQMLPEEAREIAEALERAASLSADEGSQA